jgi:Tol biopolymer transport system component/DNA-binding winged helix-turn-helix (wHTH) protein
MGDLSISRGRFLRFGPFELDVRAGELHKHGIRIKLREQPVQILLLLLEHPGEVVLREEIRLRLWPNDTIVEFDHGINAAIQKLRVALGDAADEPRYVETVARRGYRFLAEVERVGEAPAAAAVVPGQAKQAAETVIDPDELSDETISHFRILNRLGAGGTGVVYRAEDLTLGRHVALKFLRSVVCNLAESMIRCFEQEARAASALNHPNICTIYGFEEAAGQPVIVMELVEGETLAARLAKGPFLLAQAISLATQITGALAEAHGKGIVHRDLKPANLMLTRTGIKVLDFGLAKIERIALGDPAPGAMMGTLHYMSPEQVQGKKADARSDIFTLGLVLYEMLTGRRAFEGDDPAAVLAAIVEREAPSLGNAAPAAVDLVLRRCLAKDPEERWQSARDLGFALEGFAQAALTEPGGEAARHAAVPSGSRRWLWAVAIGLVLLAAAAAVWPARRTSASLENPLANAQLTRLTDFPGSEEDAAVSSDGRFVVFLADRDGPLDVFLTQVGTGRFLNLTQGSGPLLVTSMPLVGFSGDGSEVWYVRETGGPMRMMPLMGGKPRVFLGPRSMYAAWTRDGSRMVYHTSDPGDPMFVADGSGDNARQIFVSGAGRHNHFPVWSPDGKWIFFVSGNPMVNEMDLWRIASTGGTPERLTHYNSLVAYPTPINETTVLYVARDSRGGGPWLWALDVQRKETRRISFGVEKYRSIAASADGRRLVATVGNPTATLGSVPILDRLADEGDVKPYPLPSLRALMPRFGPNALFYLSSQGAGDGLWRYQNGEVLEIWKGSTAALLEPPAVSSDGRRVAFVLRQNGNLRLRVETSEGTESQDLGGRVGIRGAPCWSPDGKWIVTGGNDGEGDGLFKIPVDGGKPVRIATGPAANPVWSPDGTTIVYAGANVRGGTPLSAVRPDGVRVEWPQITVQRDGERMRFLPNGKSLVYMQGQGDIQDFWILDIATKRTRQLAHLTANATMRTFDITPDGKQIVFDRLRENSDIVLIELQGKDK